MEQHCVLHCRRNCWYIYSNENVHAHKNANANGDAYTHKNTNANGDIYADYNANKDCNSEIYSQQTVIAFT